MGYKKIEGFPLNYYIFVSVYCMSDLESPISDPASTRARPWSGPSRRRTSILTSTRTRLTLTWQFWKLIQYRSAPASERSVCRRDQVKICIFTISVRSVCLDGELYLRLIYRRNSRRNSSQFMSIGKVSSKVPKIQFVSRIWTRLTWLKYA